MVEIRPFRGIRYNPAKAGDMALNVCPPFDVITPSLQKDLYERSQYNLVRLELARRGLGDDPYTSAAETQRQWATAGVLKRDSEPSFYVTEETFEFAGQKMVRRGFIAATRLEEYDREIVLPHEYVRSEWVNDRVRLMGAAQAVYSPLLVVFRDDLRSTVGAIVRAVAGGMPSIDIKPPDLPALRMWQVTDPGTQMVLAASLKDSQLFIADGHHRYEAALRYHSRIRSEREVAHDESINYRMMLLVSVDEPGLITRGYHRTIENPSTEELDALKRQVKSLCRLEKWTPPAGDDAAAVAAAFADALGRRQDSELVFGIMGFEPGAFHIARAKSLPPVESVLEASEYSRLHDLVIKPALVADRVEQVINFQHDLVRVIESVRNGDAAMAFAMRPVPMSEFISIVTRGWRLPPKATNFFPKPSAGAVIQTLEGTL